VWAASEFLSDWCRCVLGGLGVLLMASVFHWSTGVALLHPIL